MTKKSPETRAADSAPARRERCWTCWRPQLACLCPVIRPFETRTHFVLLMHPREAKHERLGTGRLTRACLPRTEICVGVDFTEDARVEQFIADPTHDPYLLYPGGELLREWAAAAAPSSSAMLEPAPLPAPWPAPLPAPEPAPLLAPLPTQARRPIRLFLLDGTWPQAKVMIKRSRNVAQLARLSIEPIAPSRFTIKQQPGDLCLSTIESVYQWLCEANAIGLESTGDRHEVLLEVLGELCRQQVACARDPHRSGYRRQPYKTAEERPRAKKWQQRKFFQV